MGRDQMRSMGKSIFILIIIENNEVDSMDYICSGAEVPQTAIPSEPSFDYSIGLEKIVNKLDGIIEQYKNNSIDDISPENSKIVNTFKLKALVDINIQDYINRVKKYTKFENVIFVVALLLLERAMDKVQDLKSSECVHKLFCASLTLSCKTLDDDDYYMTDLSKIYGIDCKILIKLESVLFFDVLNCKVHITDREYRQYLSSLK